MEITLKNGKCRAVIFSKGSELKSLLVNGRELMWSGDPMFWANTSPVLFPMIGTLKEGKTIINGKDYRLPKHGFVRDFEHTPEQISAASATLSMEQNETTKACFPFLFKFTIKYTLVENGIEITKTVKNNSDTDMPFCIGAHPAFATPGDFSEYRLEFPEVENVSIPNYNTKTGVYENDNRRVIMDNTKTLPLNHEMFMNDVLHFEKPVSRSVSLLNKDNKGVRVDFPDYTNLGIWQAKNAPFLCIEPWCGSQDYDNGSGVFAEKFAVVSIKPNEEKSFTYTITSVE